MKKKREPKSGLERELESVRDVVRALKRLDSDHDRARVLGTAIAFVKGARLADVRVSLATGDKIDWREVGVLQ